MRKHTPGNWCAFNMVHAERGDAMTPEEIGEYVKNSVIKSIESGGSADRFLFISTDEDGSPDICLIGNGPDGPANAALITAASPMYAILDELESSFDEQVSGEMKHEELDPPDDREYAVNVTERQLRAIRAAVLKAEPPRPIVVGYLGNINPLGCDPDVP